MKALQILTVLLVLVSPGMTLHASSEVPAGQAAHVAANGDHAGAASSEAHGSEHAPKTYFGIPGWILRTLNMIAFFGVLVYLLRGPVGSFFRERRQTISHQLEEAKVRRAKAENLAADIQAKLSQLEAEVAAILQRSSEDGERQKQELLAAAELEAAKILTTANAGIEARLKQARTELAAYAGQLATERAHALLASNLTSEDRHRIFEQSVQKINEVRS